MDGAFFFLKDPFPFYEDDHELSRLKHLYGFGFCEDTSSVRVIRGRTTPANSRPGLIGDEVNLGRT